MLQMSLEQTMCSQGVCVALTLAKDDPSRQLLETAGCVAPSHRGTLAVYSILH